MAIIEKGQGVNVGETEIPDNQVAISITSTDAKDYITLDTTDGSEKITLSQATNIQDSDVTVVTNSADDVAKSLVFTKSKSATDGGHTPVDDDTVLGNIVFEGSDSTGAFEPGAKIRAQVAAGTIGDGRIPTELIFSTAPDSASAPIDRLTITPDGDVKFGSANYYPMIQSSGGGTSAGSVTYSFINDSDTGLTSGGSSNTCGIATLGTYRMYFTADGNVGIGLTNPANVLDVVGNASKSVGGTAWVDTSDSRIKTDVQNIENALEKISQLRPVSFNYTEDYLSVHPEIDGSKRYNSFVAQEYAEVFPDAVTSTGALERIVTPESEGVEEVRETLIEDLHRYTPHDLTMYLVRAVQELTSQNEGLAARVATLEAGD